MTINKDTGTLIYLSRKDKARLKALATKNDRSMAKQIQYWLDKNEE